MSSLHQNKQSCGLCLVDLHINCISLRSFQFLMSYLITLAICKVTETNYAQRSIQPSFEYQWNGGLISFWGVIIKYWTLSVFLYVSNCQTRQFNSQDFRVVKSTILKAMLTPAAVFAQIGLSLFSPRLPELKCTLSASLLKHWLYLKSSLNLTKTSKSPIQKNIYCQIRRRKYWCRVMSNGRHFDRL